MKRGSFFGTCLLIGFKFIWGNLYFQHQNFFILIWILKQVKSTPSQRAAIRVPQSRKVVLHEATMVPAS